MYSKNLIQPYLKALKNPLPELMDAFNKEKSFLENELMSSCGLVVLDVGCGIGRPLISLAKTFQNSLFVGLDNNHELISIARKSSQGLDNILFREADVFQYPLGSKVFDISYSSFNTIGSFDQLDMPKFIDRQTYFVRDSGRIFTSTWSRDDKTTKFLEKYYPSIGLKIIDMDEEYTVTNEGIFWRLSPKHVFSLYDKAGFTEEQYVVDCGVWQYMAGRKKS